jgi:hypothetical protein
MKTIRLGVTTYHGVSLISADTNEARVAQVRSNESASKKIAGGGTTGIYRLTNLGIARLNALEGI